MREMNRCEVVVVLLECADVTVTYGTSGMSGMWVRHVVCADVTTCGMCANEDVFEMNTYHYGWVRRHVTNAVSMVEIKPPHNCN